jgi:hypothetical protein
VVKADVNGSLEAVTESLRKLDSLVVNEISQEETVTGTTEVVRNANYGHSLTVIYYQILRHLKIETGVAGVRECLFVPFAISPFTVARAYRWRESIGKYLRDAQYAGAIKCDRILGDKDGMERMPEREVDAETIEQGSYGRHAGRDKHRLALASGVVEQRQVRILAIAVKESSRLFLGGEEVEL